jgi:trimethylamine--corrinoid protein Co-methyltransferase
MLQSHRCAPMTPFLSVLSEDQIYAIHRATLDVLEKTGYRILSKSAVDLLKKAGGLVDGDIVKIPEHIVEGCLRLAPKGFVLYDRQGNRAMEIHGRRVFFGSFWASPNTRDALTGEVHPTRVEDIVRGAIIADALPNIDFVTPMGYSQDVPAAAADLYEFEAVVTHSQKPIFCIPYSVRGLEIIYEMAARVAGGMDRLQERPFIVTYTDPITPLVYPREAAKRILYTAALGMPTVGAPVVQAGLTTPVTLAGSLVMANAETLMGLVLTQLKRASTPYIMAANTHSIDMATANYVQASPEMSLMLCAYADVVRSYGLPTWGTAGVTDAKDLDQQAGIEGAFSLLSQALSGINLIHDVGYMDMGMANAAEMLVMGDEIVAMVKRFLRGVEVNSETLAREVIEKVGPGGNFLQEDHTLKHFRAEHWIPSLMDRQAREAWETTGAKTMGDRIRNKIRHLLETHRAPALSDTVLKELERLRKEGTKEIVDSLIS